MQTMLQISTFVSIIHFLCVSYAHVESSKSLNHYVFGRDGQAIAVQIQKGYHSATVKISQQRDGQIYQDNLNFPTGWRATSREENGGLPAVILWKPTPSTEVLTILTTSDSSPNWGYRRLALFQFHDNIWHLLSRDFGHLEFHNVGSFYTQGHNLYIWDSQYDSRYSFAAPEKYALKRFVWRDSQLVIAKTSITARRHELFGIAYLSQHRQPKDDPLKEFGLKWRWWNTSATDSKK